MAKILDAISLGAIPLTAASISLEGDVPKSRIQIARTGNWPASTKRRGGFAITTEMLTQMVANHGQETPIDYNHLSIPPNAITPDQGVAAGWHERLELEGNDKLFAINRWTPKAALHIQNQEYRYISPTFLFDSIDPATSLHTGAKLLCSALTNYPFLTGMQPVALSELHGLGIVSLADAEDLSFDQRRSMVAGAVNKKFENSTDFVYLIDIFEDNVIINRGGRYFKLTYSIKAGGEVDLGADLTEVVTSYVTLTAVPPSPTGARTMPDNPTEPSLLSLQADIQRMSGLVTTLQATTTEQATQLTAAQAANTALQEELKKTKATNRVAALVAEGKILPAQVAAYEAIALSNMELFETLAATMTPVIKLNTQHGGDAVPGSTVVAEVPPTGDAALDARLKTARGDDAISLMSTLVDRRMKATTGMSYSGAMNAVANDYPDLVDRYREAFVVAGSPGQVQ